MVAEQFGVSPQTAGKWRARFLRRRLDGLDDGPRPGAPRKVTDDIAARVVARTHQDGPPNATRWSTRSMADATGLSQSTVARIWLSKWWARSCRFTGSANDTSHALRDNCARPRIWGRESEEGLPRVFRPPAANSVQLPAGRCGLRRESDLTLDVHPADAQRTASRRSRDGQSSAGVHRCLAPLLDGDLHLDDGRGSKGCRLETCPHRLA
ncbi:MAG: helix-turn-helix domain-containing protein [Chloroflexi bacterium]|nr:MAG: helix-turn-helix domain-containing protein [Chloroflexota bacterium]